MEFILEYNSYNDIFQEFFDACKNNNAEKVEELINHPKMNDVEINNYFDAYSDMFTPIQIACVEGNTEVVRILVKDKRVRAYMDDNDALIQASGNGSTEIVKMLLPLYGVNPAAMGQDAYELAIKNGHLDVVKLLIEDGRIDPELNRPMELAVKSRNAAIVEYLLKHVDPSKYDNGPIIFASQIKHNEIIDLLLTDNRVVQKIADDADRYPKYLVNKLIAEFELDTFDELKIALGLL